jgi:hypothetical protein
MFVAELTEFPKWAAYTAEFLWLAASGYRPFLSSTYGYQPSVVESVLVRSAASFRALPLFLPLALSAGCSEEPVLSTQLLVGIHAGGALTDRLSEVRIAVYPLDAAGKLGTPTTQSFAIAKDADAANDGAREVLPLSFGITRGKSERLRLLVEGYVDDLPTAVVEHKLNVGFLEGSVASVKVLLTKACYRLTEPCSEDTTCDSESQACRDVEDVLPLRSVDVLDEVDLPDDPACRNCQRDCDASGQPRVCVDGLWEPRAHCATAEVREAGSCITRAPVTTVACPGPGCVEPVPTPGPGECTDDMSRSTQRSFPCPPWTAGIRPVRWSAMTLSATG